MNLQYEVLNPWSEVDPLPLKGINPRPNTLAGKTIGLFCSNKIASGPMTEVVAEHLKQRFPEIKFSRFAAEKHWSSTEIPEARAKYQAWAKGVDAIVAAVGD
ncbi:MAG: hypothetical protein HYX90_00365 [Chloroflexi bacterium]|nr:hypothetical protein [Chloroflexota bacterium]